MTNEDRWYGWIPTNLGTINFDFINENNISNISSQYEYARNKNTIHICNLDVSLISDSSAFYKKIYLPFRSQKEYSPKVNISLKKMDNFFKGEVKFYYPNTSIYWNANFKVKLNGIIEFEFTKEYDSDNREYIKQILFIILKMIIHGDNHHHQKIDTALRITNEKFDEEKLLDNMLLHIKTIEKNIKSLNRKCSTRLKQNITINEVEGYISYMNTFVVLFDTDELKLKDKLQIAINIKNSLSSLINKREEKFNATNSFKTLALTVLALFIATNIFANSFYGIDLIGAIYEAPNKGKWFWHILFVYIAIFIFFSLCDIKSYFYYRHYKMFRFFGVIKSFLGITIEVILILIGIILILISGSIYYHTL